MVCHNTLLINIKTFIKQRTRLVEMVFIKSVSVALFFTRKFLQNETHLYLAKLSLINSICNFKKIKLTYKKNQGYNNAMIPAMQLEGD